MADKNEKYNALLDLVSSEMKGIKSLLESLDEVKREEDCYMKIPTVLTTIYSKAHSLEKTAKLLKI